MIDLISTKAKVTNVDELRKVIDFYAIVYTVDLNIDEDGLLNVVQDQDAGKYDCLWPQAITYDDLPFVEDYSDELSYFDDYFEVYGEKGDEGFLTLLGEVAAFLETPLMILALEYEDGNCFARVWHVKPGTKEVETLDVSSV